MTPARNLQLFPGNTSKASARREKGTYSLTDNAVVAYQKTHGAADTRVLTALSERANFRQKALSVPELMLETELGQRAVEKALKALEGAGLCHRNGRVWAYGKAPANAQANRDANTRANVGANDRAYIFSGDFVPHGKSFSLKEVEGSWKEEKINTNNIYSLGIDWPAQFPPTAVGGGAAEKNLESVTSEQQAPDGAASSEASTDNPSHSQVKNVSSEEKNENAPESETVPPAAPPALAPPETYREAQEVLSSAGFWDVWQKWVKSHRLSRAAQDLQIIDFAVWVQVGLGEILRQHAHEITKLGSFGHPFAGLQGRMQAALAVKKAEQHNVAEVVRVFGVPQCQAGERRRDPATGKVWTVEEIAYGMVIFEEGAAPQNVADAVAAGWAVVE